MHGHKSIHETNATTRSGPGFPGRGARNDRLGGAPRGRGGGRGRGRDDAFGFGGGRHGGMGAGFGPPMFGRGPKRGRGDVRVAILALLAEEPMHGYQIITELTERSGGVWRPSPGSVYPTLQAMEDQGLVTADKAEGRRVFSLTAEGRTTAEEAGDGPAPWERAARGADRSLVDLRGLMVEVAAATMQVGRSGSEGQVKAVGEILADTRRRIYLVLAEGASTPGSDESAQSAASTDADEPASGS
jgi:DNA-binding PadR family transcriptional regulator